jgi:hypothetical protein
VARAKKTTPDSGTEKFNELIRLAELDLWNEFERARLFNQQGDVGTARESAVGRFLIDQLPGRYRVAAGEVVDRNGNSTGQTDLMIYDGTLTRPLYVRDSSVLLPAEALLAAVEVKTTRRKAIAESAASAHEKSESYFGKESSTRGSSESPSAQTESPSELSRAQRGGTGFGSCGRGLCRY